MRRVDSLIKCERKCVCARRARVCCQGRVELAAHSVSFEHVSLRLLPLLPCLHNNYSPFQHQILLPGQDLGVWTLKRTTRLQEAEVTPGNAPPPARRSQ